MNSCRKMTELMSQQLDRPLSVSERIGLRFHLMMCRGCRNFSRNMAQLRQIFLSARGPLADEQARE
jgi:predicted anti-sigma-YlaC factor YlaD